MLLLAYYDKFWCLYFRKNVAILEDLKIITGMRKDEENGSCEEAAKASCIEFLQGHGLITICKCLAEKLCGIRQNEMQWFEGKVS